jgi:hypothetical protein
MEFGKLIESIQSGETEKIAAAPAEETDAGKALEVALEKVAAAAPQQAAESGDPLTDLMKMASDMAGTEKEVEVKHAALLGHTFADAAIGTWAAYDAELTKNASESVTQVNEQVKEAAIKGYQDTVAALATEQTPEKVAGTEDVETLVKQAEAQGYSREDVYTALNELSTKTAEEQFTMGQQTAVDEVYTTVYNEFLKGAAVAANVLEVAPQ